MSTYPRRRHSPDRSRGQACCLNAFWSCAGTGPQSPLWSRRSQRGDLRLSRILIAVFPLQGCADSCSRRDAATAKIDEFVGVTSRFYVSTTLVLHMTATVSARSTQPPMTLAAMPHSDGAGNPNGSSGGAPLSHLRVEVLPSRPAGPGLPQIDQRTCLSRAAEPVQSTRRIKVSATQAGRSLPSISTVTFSLSLNPLGVAFTSASSETTRTLDPTGTGETNRTRSSP